MSQTANYDSSVRIRRLKERALAAFRNNNPGQPEFANSQGDALILQERRVGQMNRVFQPPAANPAIVDPACGCETTAPAPAPAPACPVAIDSFFPDSGGDPEPPFTQRIIYSYSPVTNNGTQSFDVVDGSGSAILFLATILEPGLVAIDTDTVEYSVVMTYIVPGCDPVSATSFPCFLAGAQVLMADGTIKAIEEVAIGDQVIGAFGEINEVLALHRPLLGSASMININGSHATTSHHPHIGADKRFYCGDVDRVLGATYGREHDVIGPNGPEKRMLHGLAPERLSKLYIGTVLQTTEGPKAVTHIESLEMGPETQLYNLVVGGSHTYTVDTYAVTGWPREDDFNYDIWA